MDTPRMVKRSKQGNRAARRSKSARSSDSLQLEVPALHVRAAVVPETLNLEDRTVEVVFSTGARTLRTSFWEEDHFEELDLSPGSVRLERMNSGAPVLDSHGRHTHRQGGSGLADMLGVVVNGTARVDGTEGRCTIQLSQREGVDDVWQDIVDGVIQNVSIAYLVHRFLDVTEDEQKIKVLRAVDWEPFEVSLVPIPVDSEAGIRSAGSETSLCTIEGEGVASMALRSTKPGKKKTGKKTTRKGTTPASRARAAATDPEEPEVDPEDPDEPEVDPQDPDEPAEPEGGEGDPGDEGDPEGDEGGEGGDGDGQRSLDTDPKPRRKKTKRKAKRTTRSAERQTERLRVLGIQKTARTLGFQEDDELVRSLIEGDEEGSIPSLDRARAQLIDAAAEEDDSMTTRSQTTTGETDRSKFRSGLENALLARAGATGDDGKPVELTDAGRELRGMTLLRLAEEALRVAGERVTGLNRMDLAARAMHATSDFPNVLENIATKMLRQAYENTTLTYRFLARQRNAVDFKQMSSVQLGTGSGLLELPEGAEIKHGTMSDTAEKFSLLTYARALTFTRQMLVNDDTSAFDRIPAQLGRKAAELEQDVAWALITGNVVMGDGTALFDAAHSNIGTGALSIASLSAGRAVMRQQTDPDGQLISAIPRILFGPAALETEMQQFTSSINAEIAGNVNPFSAGQFSTVFAEPRLDVASALQWYMATDPAQLDVMQYGYLEGEAGPRIESMASFDRDGIKFRILHDFYAAVLEFRGLYRSSGA